MLHLVPAYGAYTGGVHGSFVQQTYSFGWIFRLYLSAGLLGGCCSFATMGLNWVISACLLQHSPGAIQ